MLLGRHPVFWIQDSGPIYAILVGAALTLVWVHFRPVPADALAIADAIGLAMFAISGAQVAEKAGCRALVVVLMGTLTGAGGGVVRDVLSAKVPLILQHEIYASAAIAGIVVYLLQSSQGGADRCRVCRRVLYGGGHAALCRAYDLRLPCFVLPQ